MWKLNNMLLNNRWITKETKKQRKMTMKARCDPKPMRHSSKREVYSNTLLSQEIRKTSSNNLTLQLKQLQIEEQTKSEVSGMKEIIKIRAEINKRDEGNS